MEDLGLYSEQPDATVDSILYDEADPSFVEVKFSDGRTATMPASHAESMPKTPVDPMTMGVPGGAPMGPPTAAEADPLGWGAAAEADPLGWDAAGRDLLVQATEAGIPKQPGYEAPLGRPTNPAPSGANIVPASGEAPPARIDPNAEIVSPGSPGAMAPAGYSETSSQTQTSTVDDPETMMARIDEGIEDTARSEHLLDTMRYTAARDTLDTALGAWKKKEEEAAKGARKAELQRAEHEKIYAAIEATPIDEDEFWSESPGRTAGAWIALALSGFLTGATRGQNPALGQMMQALDGAQDRWLANQQKSRDGRLRQREKLMGSAENARDTYRLQLSGIVEKRIQLDAQREGLQPPPSLSTYIAKKGVQRAEWKNAIGSRADESATRAVENEFKQTAATGPVRRGDVVLQNLLGADWQKKRESAFDPKDGNLPGAVTSADRIQAINKRLGEIKAKYDGLPQQNKISWSSMGAAGIAARSGSEAAKDQLEASALLKEASLMLKQASGNTKLFDSNVEREDLQAQLDTGEPETTMAAINVIATRANEAAIGAASRYTSDPQKLIEYVRQTSKNNPGVQTGGVSPKRTIPAAGGEERAVQETKAPEPAQPAGGGATRPLADGQPQAWRPVIRAHAEEAGYNPDALERIIAFESGGKPSIRNPSGATGLIQFMPKVFEKMKKPPGYENVTHDDLKDLSVEEQMPLVISYLEERGLKPDADVGEYYLAVAAPGLLNKPDDTVAYKKGSKAWEQNPSWRPADGGDITAGSIRAKGRKL